MGTVVMEQGPNGVLVSADITGLAPGPHGFHIHETGRCSPDFAAAGDHFAPEGREHGYMNPSGDHAGDMPNIHAAADGTAKRRLLQRRYSLGSRAGQLGNGRGRLRHHHPREGGYLRSRTPAPGAACPAV